MGKREIAEKESLPVDEQRLVFAGKHLDEDNETLSAFAVHDLSTIEIALRLRGGGKKRKHKHNKEPLRVLDYYKVDEDGKVTRQRREFNDESCGAGIFMANHKDRYYCGRCHLTLKFSNTE